MNSWANRVWNLGEWTGGMTGARMNQRTNCGALRGEKNGRAEGTDYSKDRSLVSLMEYGRAKVGGDDRALRK